MAIPGNLLSPTTEMIDPNTSGWTTKLNCTISKGGGGRNGDGCLLVKSIAAGETQVRTVSSYTVTPGAVYEAFADASGATVPERIGIRWLDPAGAEISITWSLVTMTAAAAWHRISVAGTAPVGTAKAQVLLSMMTPAAPNVVSYFENVYLGLPLRTTGNLFGFGTESTEIDASGWTPEVNATVSRQVPVFSWAVDWYWAGGHTLAVTATAAGNAAAATVDRPSVTPGVEYLAYAYLQPPTLSSVAWLELRFYDANGNQIQATRATLAPPGTGFYRQLLSAVAPAAAATCGIAAGLDGAAAGQVLRLETVVVRNLVPLVTGTVIPYSSSSFEQGTGGWTVTSGPATLARSTPWGAAAYSGNYSLTVTSATAATSTLRSPLAPVTEGVNWRAQIIVRHSAGSWTSVRVRTHWYDSGGDLGTSTGLAYAVPPGSWYLLTSDATAPAGATQAAVEVVPVAAAAASVLWVDGVALWQVLPLTAVEAVSAGGYIQLTLRELPADYLISVYRITPDGARTLVRGPNGLINQQPIDSDAMVLEDHEAPIGVTVSYRIELYSTNGVLAATRSSEPVTLSLADINTSWLKDPANPQRNCLVLVQQAPEWERPIEQAAFVIRGRRNKVVLSGRRQGLEGDLSIWTRTDAEREALHLLLDSGNVLLWQAAPGMGVDDMYVSVANISEGRIGKLAQEQWRAWTLPLTEQDMPVTAGVNGAAGRTWQDVVAEFATCADLLDVYATSEDLLLDRRMG
ncbi:carbohydrate binding domain-containing protein [Streptomyces sp. enrichment culture]|uniref:carbohydrate binding domain-containing protein n=1 Tax=Streptomyces sp. enrichment culture TaxID=1795815 RepID=UPI003F54714B